MERRQRNDRVKKTYHRILQISNERGCDQIGGPTSRSFNFYLLSSVGGTQTKKEARPRFEMHGRETIRHRRGN